MFHKRSFNFAVGHNDNFSPGDVEEEFLGAEEALLQMMGLKDAQADEGRHVVCLEAIGPQRIFESDVAYTARKEVSYPGTINHSFFILDKISLVPDEGMPMSEGYYDYLRKLERQGLKSDLELFEDGVISRQDLVLLNAGWGKQLRDARLFKPATDDEASDLRARYLEALDIDIQDDDLVESLLTMEKFTRLNMRHAVRAYLSTHEVIPEPACDGLQNDGKQILVPGGFKR